jgi:hypothetical protein
VVARFTVQEAKDSKFLDTPGGAELMQRLGPADGLPFFAFLDSSGAPIVSSIMPRRDGKKGGNIGHPMEPFEIDWFLIMLDKAAPRMTAAERGAIEKALRAQKR